jgi:hypothetical protein
MSRLENADYSTRIAATKRAERIATVKSAGELWKEGIADGKEGAARFVSCANKLSQAGVELNQASGHEQLLLNADGLDFIQKDILPHLPAGMDIFQIEYCVTIARVMPKPVKRLEEIPKAAMQMVFFACELEKRKVRLASLGGAATPSNIFVSTLQSAREDFDKWRQWVLENPSDPMRAQSKEAVLSQLKWPHDAYEDLQAGKLV